MLQNSSASPEKKKNSTRALRNAPHGRQDAQGGGDVITSVLAYGSGEITRQIASGWRIVSWTWVRKDFRRDREDR